MAFRLNKRNIQGNQKYLYEMAFKLDANNKGGDFQIVERGDYEVYPVAFEKSFSSNGNEMATFNYVIRDDVDQKFKGREIRFDRFVFTDAAMWRVNQASEAAGLDMNKEFADGEAWASEFKNKAVKITVDHEERNGKTYPTVKGFKKSDVGGTRADTGDDGTGQIDIKDDDLPF
jgi:hypothetical protein